MKFLIIGIGSMGQRHLKNLKKIGQKDLVVFDSNKKRLKQISGDFKVETVDFLTEGLGLRPTAVFICTPTSLHMESALKAAEAGCHLFIEKPISHNLKGVDKLIRIMREKQKVLMVGFNLRFHPLLLKIRKILKRGRLGKIWGARIEAGSYLPDWHAHRDYSKEYSANKKLGGGVILDAIHEIDYALWLFGKVKRMKSLGRRIGDLKIDTEDLVEILLEFNSGLIAELHLDYLQRVPQRKCEIIGQKGTLLADLLKAELRIFLKETGKWQQFKIKNFNFESLYREEVKRFLDCIKIGENPPVDGREAKYSLMIALQVKKDIL